MNKKTNIVIAILGLVLVAGTAFRSGKKDLDQALLKSY